MTRKLLYFVCCVRIAYGKKNSVDAQVCCELRWRESGLHVLHVVSFKVIIFYQLINISCGHYKYHQFNINKFCVLPTQCLYVFCVDLRTNSDYFTVQHWLTGFYNWDGVCLLRGTVYILRSAHRVYLCVLCGSENKQRLFHCTALTDWLVFMTETECVYCAVRSTFYVLPTQRICVFCVDFRTNNDYFTLQHWLVGFCNWDGVCLLRGTTDTFNLMQDYL